MTLAPQLKSILTLTLIVGTIASCGTDQTIKDRYEAERLYSQADEMATKAFIRPELGAGQNLDGIYGAFHKALTFSLEALRRVDTITHVQEFMELSSLAHRSATRLTKMYFAEDQFDSCISLMTTVLDETRLPRDETITVFYNLGQALQSYGQVDSATTVYRNIIEIFYPPIDRTGQPVQEVVNLPLFLTHVASLGGDTAKANQESDFAENYYLTLIDNYPESNLATLCNGNLARLYYDARQWNKSIEYLDRMVDSTGQVAITARFRIADIQSRFQRDNKAALKTLDDILGSLKKRDTVFIPVARFKKAVVHLEWEQTAEARQIISDIQQNYKRYDLANPRVQLMKARSFDVDGNWDRAETEYKFLISRHGESREGLATYLYLAQRLKEQGRENEAQEWYNEAEQKIALLIARGSGTVREAVALTYRADLYRAQDRWEEAARSLTTAYEKFPDEQIGRNCLLTGADIYRNRLNQPEKADSLIQELKQNLPLSPPEWES